MRALETSAHVGSDGILKLELPVGEADRDVQVVVVIEAQRGTETNPASQERASSNRAASVRKEVPGVRFPDAGSWNLCPVEPLRLQKPGPSASEMLVNDRR
jgi:hypothetical protein